MGSSAEDVFQVLDRLISAPDVATCLSHYRRLCHVLRLSDLIGRSLFFVRLRTDFLKFKQKLIKFSKINQILQKLDKRLNQHKVYQTRPLHDQRVLVIGGGVSGLRVAIEMLLLGARVTCVEKRDDFSRNNVIHLWPNVIQDLRQLAAKRFYGRFCVGSIDHISIRQLQLILLKIALILGLRFEPNVTFQELCPEVFHRHQEDCHPPGDGGVCHFLPEKTSLESEYFDVIVGSDGRRNTLFQDFPRKEFRGKLAIAITANFVNRRSEAESRAQEISGVSYIYAQKWFKDLFHETGVQLENICYYRDDTHYFVMTATKTSLLRRKVLKSDLSETQLLLSEDNIDRRHLLEYARDAAHWTTGLRHLEFALNANQSPDVALFDFTSVYAARNASRVKKVRVRAPRGVEAHKHVLMMLTGDSLLEPFWPTGSGAGRGFLSALDAAYCALQWTQKVVKGGVTEEAELLERMSDVIAERESIYRLLAQTTPENIQSKEFSVFPQQRYQNWRQNSVLEIKPQILHLIGLHSGPIGDQNAKRARRATVAVTSRDLNLAKTFNQSEERIERQELEPINVEEPVRGRGLGEKEAWLFGVTSFAGNKALEKREKAKKKEEIVERAKELEKVLKKSDEMYLGKLQKVGKIEEGDWNFRVWQKKETHKEEQKDLDKHKKSSKVILNSRKTQIENKMKESFGHQKAEEGLKGAQRGQRAPNEGVFIQMIEKELNDRMSQKKEEKKRTVSEGTTGDDRRQPKDDAKTSKTTTVRQKDDTKTTDTEVSSLPKCYRCGLEVSSVDRISVSGDILHRSCLRCSKCGISLRLNEFRNELKFLCVFCLKNNSKNIEKSENRFSAKQKFLSEIEKIDFRERIGFENKSENKNIEIVEKTALNERSEAEEAEDEPEEDDEEEESEEELTFDSNSSECDTMDDIDDSDDWATTSDDSRDDARRQPPEIPSICVETTTDDDMATTDQNDNRRLDDSKATDECNANHCRYRYSGQFTEKLFRSKSQPMLRMKAFRPREVPPLEVDDCLPFADICAGDQCFSPLKKCSKAPIIEFKDI